MICPYCKLSIFFWQKKEIFENQTFHYDCYTALKSNMAAKEILNKKNLFTAGEYIGMGAYSFFFKIREDANLGVKIAYDELYDENQKHQLERELAKAQILTKLGVPVPKYVGVVNV